MSYKKLPLEEKHFGDFEILKDKTSIGDTLSASIQKVPSSNNEELVVKIKWECTLLLKDSIPFNYIAETEAIINVFDAVYTTEDVHLIVQDLLTLFIKHWEEKTTNTILHEYRFKYDEIHSIALIDNIMYLIQEQRSLNT